MGCYVRSMANKRHPVNWSWGLALRLRTAHPNTMCKASLGHHLYDYMEAFPPVETE